MNQKYSGQHGLSVFIETDDNILFDTGPSGVILDNARLAGIDLKGTDWIVLSHGHWDHGDGLIALAEAGIRTRLLVHPGVFSDRRRASGTFNGLAMSRTQAAQTFDLIETTAAFQINEDVWFLGEIPRINEFEARQTTFYYVKDGKKLPDHLPDDTALAIRTKKGLVIVTGCSHAGICNICEWAKQVASEDRLFMVLGGFHLSGESEILEKTIAYFQRQKVAHLYPMHCTALPALARFYAAFKIEKRCTGDVIEIE
jgi:7,8-dihydropterin-6-yl-methyl-4-(beta-D-ribofuranosyl)aminobenzene 5'-phosphate synthase